MDINKLLLIVDVQNGFINSNTAHIPPLVEKLQYEYSSVVATRFINLPDSQYRRLIHWDKLSPGSKEIEFAFDLRSDAIVVEKNVYTCVTDDFVKLLREKHVDEVDICGIDTDICVTKCAVDLFEKNITPVVLKDYCATHAQEDIQDASLIILSRYIGRDQIK